jgi:Putative Na+/H+ antiporter
MDLGGADRIKKTFVLAAAAIATLSAAWPAWASGKELPKFEADGLTGYVAAALFGGAIAHTFVAGRFNKLAHRFREGSALENLFHFLGEVEVVFGLWAGALVLYISVHLGMPQALSYLEREVDFTEATFVFVIMTMAATRPVMLLVDRLIGLGARMIPLHKEVSFYATALIVGPLLGSFITEPAAMTVTALVLKQRFFDRQPRPTRLFLYGTLGLLFVNISIGGTLTHFAAPPVLMVVEPWGWDLAYMFTNFGWKAALAVVIGTSIAAAVFRKELEQGDAPVQAGRSEKRSPPVLLTLLHLVFMGVTVAFHAHVSFFLPLFLFFLGMCTVTGEYQDRIMIREGLLVGFFLGGLVTLGSLQGWWLKPMLSSMPPIALFFGATGLTAFTDNAAITFLGTQVESLNESARYMLVAGAVTGGGLTVIANAPNPAGFGILKDSFGESGIKPLLLVLGALPFTLLATVAFLLL